MKRFAIVVAALLACACKKKPPAPAAVASDAGANAEAGSPAIAEEPFVVVAEGPAGVRLTKTIDGRIVVADGPMLYEAKPDGTLARIIPASEMARLLPEDDVVVGYSETREIRTVSGSLSDTLLLDTVAMPISNAGPFALHAGKLAPIAGDAATLVMYRGHVLAWNYNRDVFRWADGADLPLPRVPAGDRVDVTDLAEGPGGSLVARPFDDRQRKLYVWKSDSDMAREVPLPPPADEHCTLAPSFADHYVVVCGSEVWALDDSRFVSIMSRTDVSVTTYASEDRNGSVYITSNVSVMRCPRSGACTARRIPSVVPVDAATYELWATEFRQAEGTLSWMALATLSTGHGGMHDDVSLQQIFARDPNDVWLVVHHDGRTQLLHPRATPVDKPMILPSSSDARILVRNERPPQPWTGACDQVYVRLGTDADAIAKREKDIRAALGDDDGLPSGSSPTWALVEGTLNGERSVGAVVSRREPTQKMALLERPVHKLVDAFATGGANRPAVFCTLPVLERRLLPR